MLRDPTAVKACERGFLDHDYVIDSEWRAYVVIGNKHPPGGVFAYEKYTIRPPTTHPWRRPGYTFERAFREYSPAIAKPARHSYYYSPEDGTIFPFISTSKVVFHLKPELELRRLFHKASDPLEEKVLSLAKTLHREVGVPYEKIGVTGSILLKIHDPEKSDIDIVLYDCSYKKAVRDKGLLEPLKGRELERWVLNASRRLKLSPAIAEKLYDPSRRGFFDGTPTTVVYVQPTRVRYGQSMKTPTVYLGLVTVKLELACSDCTHHYYPHRVKGIIRGVIRGPSTLLGFPSEITIYESLYSGIIDKYKHIIVTGKATLHGSRLLKIVVGVRETVTTIHPAV